MNADAQAGAGARARAAWTALAPRERRLVSLAAAAVVLALLWLLALAPALATLRSAPAQRAQLQAEAQRMQALRDEAQALKALPRLDPQEAQRALEASTRARLGSAAQFSMVGERAQVTVRDVSAQDLADWLADARANARASVVDARLTRGGERSAGTSASWSGTLSLSLPQ